ncbi:MAG: hypothetical protein ACW97O_10000, partial [Candidatus Thorarchaeota archaeon]
MRKSLIPIIIIMLIFAIPSNSENQASLVEGNNSSPFIAREGMLSSAGGSGSDASSDLYLSRSLSDWTTGVLNTYGSPNTHQGVIDLSSHLIAGWTLYSVEIQVDNITAAPEREVLVTSPNSFIEIWNDTAVGDVYDALYQAFYGQPHDGKLINYSLGYRAPYYNSANGDAYLGVWTDYTDYTTAVTSLVTPFAMTSSVTTTTHDTSGDNAILDAGIYYYVVINGTHMTGSPPPPQWLFNIISWRSTDAFEGLDSGYHYRNDNNWYDYTGPVARQEAELNYTYTPWNSSGGVPLVYAQPEDVSLDINSTAMTGSTWRFTSSSGNITSLQIDSSQSAFVNHNITLWYKKTVTTANSWDVRNSGDIMYWNATTVAAYPSVSGTLSRFANISVGGDWVVSGLYESSSPSVDYGNYVDYGVYIHCSNMYDETWTLTFSGYNHVTSLASYVAAVNSSVINILSNVDIDASIEQFDTSAVTTGNANLTIWHEGSTIQPPQVDPVSDGTFNFAWDIDSTTPDNGTYSILVYWTNGTEAGYREIPVVVYFPTTLTAASSYIEGYADSTVDVSVYFEDSFTPKALNGTYSSVKYSFSGAPNITMTDHANGTWTASVDTTGKAIGLYALNIYGEGFAIENATESMIIAIVEPTKDLVISWVENNTITFIQKTNLTVIYEYSNNTRVFGATVEVTDGSTIWILSWDSVSETYWKEFTGTHFGVPGAYPLTVTASKVGVETQVNDTLSITIFSESTSLTPSWPYFTFYYSESVIFSVDYTDHLGTPIPGAEVRDISINGSGYVLIDEGNGTYWLELDNAYDLGNHSVSVFISKTGYQFASLSNIWFYIEIANTNVATAPIVSPIPMQVYYTHSDNLTITLTDDEGDPINSATVELEYNGMNHSVVYDSPGVYIITINGSDGLGSYPIRMFTYKYGFYDTINAGIISIVETPTALDASGTRIVGVYTTLYNDGSITFNVLYEDATNGTPLTSAIVNITINSITYNLSAGPTNFTLTL